MRWVLVALLISAALLAGCASSPQLRPAAVPVPVHPAATETPDTLPAYAPLQTDDFFAFHDDGPLLYAPPPPLNARPMPPPTSVAIAADSLVSAQPQAAEGYRIQLFAGRDKQTAKRLSSLALSRLTIPVYLTYEAPQYKVRVGNFTVREEAAEWCERLRREGFPDAWIVRAIVNIQRQ